MTFQYAAKVVCGTSAGEVVAPGVYFTAINVHNPEHKASVSRPSRGCAAGIQARPGSKLLEAGSAPDEALEIDCPDIMKLAQDEGSS